MPIAEIGANRDIVMEQIRKNIERHLNELCLHIGSRHLGSPGEAAAAEYIEKVFQEYGYQTVRETYPVTGWNFVSFELFNLTRKRPVPAATACFFSNTVEIEGELLWLKRADLADPAGLSVAGRICMVDYAPDGYDVMGLNHIAEELDRHGAAAAIFLSTIHTSLAPSTKIQRSPFLRHLGTCAVAEEGAFDLALHRNDRYRLNIHANCFPHTSSNIIAGKPGGPSKGVIGAHYDSAPLIQGAADNASGTVMLLELARLLRGDNSGWALDFAAFSAEEYVPESLPPGSGDYYRRHRSENLKWFMNFDDYGAIIGEPKLEICGAEKLPPLQPGSVPHRMVEVHSGDAKAFHEAGIPTLWYYDRNVYETLHTVRDTVEYLNVDAMAEGVRDAAAIVRQLTKA